MISTLAPSAPPFCPNPRCPYHRGTVICWRYVRAGFFARVKAPCRIQRYQCCHCRRYFSDQTFRSDYWLRRPDLLLPVFHRLLGCSAYRQIAREFGVSPQTVLTHAARLGRHCLLFHEQLRPREIHEPVALDGFQSFEYSQYHPTLYHVLAGVSHYFYGFTGAQTDQWHPELTEGTTPVRMVAPRGRERDFTLNEDLANHARAWILQQKAVAPDRPQIVARFTGGEAGLLSGLMRNPDQIRNRPMVVDAPSGKGRVIMFANNPIYRWQTFGEHGMVFNALMFWNDMGAAGAAKPSTAAQ